MTGALARVAAALAALVLASFEARTWWAEQAYEAGIYAVDPRTGEPATDQPARDLPGRLEWYEEALARDPGEPLYALRAGQIRLHRATRRPPPTDARAELARARHLLGIALPGAPLDSHVHSALSHALMTTGDLDGVAWHSRAAAILGPRRISTLEPAAQRLVWAWRIRDDPSFLAGAIDAARLGYELSDGREPSLPPMGWLPAAGTVARLFASPDRPPRRDLDLVVGMRPDLLPTIDRLAEGTDVKTERDR